MRILIDQNDIVRAKTDRLVRMALANRDRWAEGLTLTETWVPDNTNFERLNGGFRVADEQPEGWSADRDEVVDRETKIEKAIELLENNPLPDLPDVTVTELPDNPTTTQVIDQVNTHTTYIQRMADEVVIHRRYVEGYRKVILGILRDLRG